MAVGGSKWTSERLFLLASIGGAVGLGNLIRFPFVLGENGGAAFLSVYLLLVLIVGFPLVLAEMIMGSRGGGGAVETLETLIKESKAKPFWKVIGWLSIILPFLGFCYYSSMVGWTMFFGFEAVTEGFQGLTAEQSARNLSHLQQNAGMMVFLHSLLIVMTVAVVGLGVKGGIERVVKFMMPALFIMLVCLVLYGLFFGDAAAAYAFLFKPDFGKITMQVVLNALGQVFFSLAIGVGMMITYASYVPQSVSLNRASLTIGMGDTLVAVLAGMAIFPIVMSLGLTAEQGPGLLFITMPVAFGQMSVGGLLAILFFGLVFAAAFTTVIGMLEPIVAVARSRFSKFSRMQVTAFIGLLIWLVGLAPTLSDSLLSNVRPLWFVPLFADFNVFRVFDFLVANLLLPINGLLLALFVGWVMKRQNLEESARLKPMAFLLWFWALRYIAPIAVFGVLVVSLIQAFNH